MAVLLTLAACGNVVVDSSPTPSPKPDAGEGGSPATELDADCLALCKVASFDCQTGKSAGSLDGVMTFVSETATGCEWSFAINSTVPPFDPTSTTRLRMDCSTTAPCMYQDGHCGVLHYWPPVDPTSYPPIGFTDSAGIWGCTGD